MCNNLSLPSLGHSERLGLLESCDGRCCVFVEVYDLVEAADHEYLGDRTRQRAEGELDAALPEIFGDQQDDSEAGTAYVVELAEVKDDTRIILVNHTFYGLEKIGCVGAVNATLGLYC